MLSKTLIFTYHDSRMELWDRYFNQLEHHFSLSVAPDVPMRTIYDEQRQLLWIFSSSRLYRYLIEDTGGTVTATEQMNFDLPVNHPNWTGKMWDIYEATGDLFFVTACWPSILYKVKVDGSSIESQLTLPVASGYDTYYSTMTVGVNQDSGDIFVMPYYRHVGGQIGTHASYAYNAPTCYVVNNNLTKYKYDLELARRVYALYTNASYYVAHNSYTEPWYGGSELVYHNILNQILLTRKTARDISIVDIDGDTDLTYLGHLNFDKYNLGLSPYIYVNKLSGNIYCYGETRMFCWYSNLEESHEKTHIDFSTRYVMYHPYTDEFYRYNYSTNQLVIYDRFGNVIDTKTFTNDPELCRILPGEEYTKVVEITSNNIILPNSMNPTSDTTPTIVFRVGVSPDNWTQQFKIIADRDISKIAKAEVTDTSFELIAESYASGTYYKDWQWQYSTNWNESSNSYNTGDWASLGSGNGVKTGGTEPDDGVNCEEARTRYVRFTIAEADKLDGLFSSDVWYFKIFSISS